MGSQADQQPNGQAQHQSSVRSGERPQNNLITWSFSGLIARLFEFALSIGLVQWCAEQIAGESLPTVSILKLIAYIIVITYSVVLGLLCYVSARKRSLDYSSHANLCPLMLDDGTHPFMTALNTLIICTAYSLILAGTAPAVYGLILTLPDFIYNILGHPPLLIMIVSILMFLGIILFIVYYLINENHTMSSSNLDEKLEPLLRRRPLVQLPAAMLLVTSLVLVSIALIILFTVGVIGITLQGVEMGFENVVLAGILFLTPQIGLIILHVFGFRPR